MQLALKVLNSLGKVFVNNINISMNTLPYNATNVTNTGYFWYLLFKLKSNTEFDKAKDGKLKIPG